MDATNKNERENKITGDKPKKLRERINQTDVPTNSIEDALKVARAIWDNYAGKPTAPINVAFALHVSPQSSNWRYITGSSAAYGLTEGGYSAKEITITPLGRKILAPTTEGEDRAAIAQSVLKPTVLRRFFEHYDNMKLPKEEIAQNVLISWGISKEKAKQTYDLIKDNGEFSGILTTNATGSYVVLSNALNGINIQAMQDNEDDEDDYTEDEVPTELLQKLNITKTEEPRNPLPTATNTIQKVFISHGKDREIVDQLRELIVFGQFEPVVSVDRESTAISVPEKVFSDMRQCQAGILHVAQDVIVFDKDGNEVRKINENVLIEIGAAIALYGKRLILLCQKGIKLPSNLQGLYYCEYEGSKLDYNSTMKLLKTFNEFKQL